MTKMKNAVEGVALAQIDAETKALEQPSAHHAELRLWLRMLTCTNLVEGHIRTRLREVYDVTLPRFDLMAQLVRAPDGMTLSQLSKRMMVTNGNVTHVVERLLASGDIDRRTSEKDRRVQFIRLTTKGRHDFQAMASAHADWIAAIFDGLAPNEIAELMRLLAKVKASALAVTSAPIHEETEK